MPNPPLERLRKRSEFVKITKMGKRIVTPAFILQVYQRTSHGPIHYGITASRKIGGAVERNRAKRRLRMLVRQSLPSLGCPGTDYVLIARSDSLKRQFALMVQDFEEALRKLYEN